MLLHRQDGPCAPPRRGRQVLARLRLRPTRHVRFRDRTPVAVPLCGQSRVHSRTKASVALSCGKLIDWSPYREDSTIRCRGLVGSYERRLRCAIFCRPAARSAPRGPLRPPAGRPARAVRTTRAENKKRISGRRGSAPQTRGEPGRGPNSFDTERLLGSPIVSIRSAHIRSAARRAVGPPALRRVLRQVLRIP